MRCPAPEMEVCGSCWTTDAVGNLVSCSECGEALHPECSAECEACGRDVLCSICMGEPSRVARSCSDCSREFHGGRVGRWSA